jgi:hypothetical protein
MPIYLIPITCDLGKTLSSVGEIVDSVNDSMANFGFPEKMALRSEICTMRLDAKRALTGEEKQKIHAMMQKTYQEKLPDNDIQVAPPHEWREEHSTTFDDNGNQQKTDFH